MRLLTLVLLFTAGTVLSVAVMPAVTACAATKIDDDVRVAWQKLYTAQPVAKTIGEKARAILVFPRIVKAGLIIGGQYGEGAPVKDGRIMGYYNSVAAPTACRSVGRRFGYALFLMNDQATAYLDSSAGWEIGFGPSIVIVDEGKAKALTTTTLRDDVYAFIFGQKGLMAGIGIPGIEDHQDLEVGYFWGIVNFRFSLSCRDGQEMGVGVGGQPL